MTQLEIRGHFISGQWMRAVLGVVLTALLVSGCAGSGTRTEPVEPSVGPTTTPDRTPAPADPTPASGGFDANGNPYVPGTTRLLPRTFYFAYDRASLGPDDLAALEMHAAVLRNNPGRRVVLEGHCDERGTREYNLALGERRADSVRRFLVSAGVPASQLETVSFGEERPENAGHSESAWGQNRRAIMLYR